MPRAFSTANRYASASVSSVGPIRNISDTSGISSPGERACRRRLSRPLCAEVSWRSGYADCRRDAICPAAFMVLHSAHLARRSDHRMRSSSAYPKFCFQIAQSRVDLASHEDPAYLRDPAFLHRDAICSRQPTNQTPGRPAQLASNFVPELESGSRQWPQREED